MSSAASPTPEPWIVYVRTTNPGAVERAAGMRGLHDRNGVGFSFYDDEKAQQLASRLTKAGFIVIFGPEPKVAAEHGVDCSHSHPASVPTRPCGSEERGGVISASERSKLERAAWRKTPKSEKAVVHRQRVVMVDEAYVAVDKLTYGQLMERSGRASKTRSSEANEAPFATTERDPKVVDAGKKWGNMSNAKAVYEALQESLNKESQEVFLVIPVDLHGDPVSPPVEVARGQRDRVTVDASDVMRPVITSNCSGFIVVHNHPSGAAKPSQADRSLTKNIQQAAKPYQPVVMIDHVIVGRREYYSIVEDKLYRTK